MAIDYTTNFTSAVPEEREFAVLPDGDYPFTILEINAFEVSKNGNDMLPLKLQFTGPGGETADVYENLVFTEKALFKIQQFIAAVAIPNGTKINFRDNEFIKYLKPRTGRAKLTIEDVPGKTYKRNKIVAFVYEGTSKRDDGPPAHKPTPPSDPVEEDSIPF